MKESFYSNYFPHILGFISGNPETQKRDYQAKQLARAKNVF